MTIKMKEAWLQYWRRPKFNMTGLAIKHRCYDAFNEGYKAAKKESPWVNYPEIPESWKNGATDVDLVLEHEGENVCLRRCRYLHHEWHFYDVVKKDLLAITQGHGFDIITHAKVSTELPPVRALISKGDV